MSVAAPSTPPLPFLRIFVGAETLWVSPPPPPFSRSASSSSSLSSPVAFSSSYTTREVRLAWEVIASNSTLLEFRERLPLEPYEFELRPSWLFEPFDRPASNIDCDRAGIVAPQPALAPCCALGSNGTPRGPGDAVGEALCESLPAEPLRALDLKSGMVGGRLSVSLNSATKKRTIETRAPAAHGAR